MTATTEATEVIENRRIIRVHETRLDEARTMVAKVNKRAVRYGLSEYSLNVSEPIDVPVYDEMMKRMGLVTKDAEPIAFETFFDVELIGEMPKIGDWSFVATLDYSEGIVITRVVPGVEMDLSIHRARPDECDHCHTKRQRNATYVLVNNSNGETMQVGSTCIQPYMGLTVNGLAWLAGDPFEDISELSEPSESYGRREPSAYLVSSVLLYTMVVEQVEGWRSRQVAMEYGGVPTSQLVNTFLGVYKLSDRDKAWRDRVAELADWDKAAEKALNVREWALAEDGGHNEWRENVRSLAGLEKIGNRNIGILASAVAGYNKAEGIRIEREQRVPSEWVGVPGAKGKDAFIPVEGTVAFAFTSESDYGTRTKYIIRTEGITYATTMSGVPFDQGDKVTGKAKVKAHETYRDEKQTVIWYAKLDKVED